MRHLPINKTITRVPMLLPEEEDSSESSSSSSSRRRRQAVVSFDKLEIFGFAKVLGDNPSAEGAPICLDIRPDYRLLLHVDEYERHRLKQRPRRHAEELRLSSLQRENYLLATGYRYDEVVNAAKLNEKQQLQRWESFENSYYWEPYWLFVENMRCLIRLFLRWVQRSELIKALCLFLLAYMLTLEVTSSTAATK